MPTAVAAPVTTNSKRLDGLVHNGKIYLSLADAIVLGLENNYDIAIQRYNLDIADTDLLRARAGAGLLGVSSGLVEGTSRRLRSQFDLAQLGRRSGGHLHRGWRRRLPAPGALYSTTNGTGPTPEAMDPVLTGTMQLERTTTPEPTPFASGAPTLTRTPTNTTSITTRALSPAPSCRLPSTTAVSRAIASSMHTVRSCSRTSGLP